MIFSNLSGFSLSILSSFEAVQFLINVSFIKFIFSVVLSSTFKAAVGSSALSGLFWAQNSSKFCNSFNKISCSALTCSINFGSFSSISFFFFSKICSNLFHSLSNWSILAKSPLNLYFWLSNISLLFFIFSISFNHIFSFSVNFWISVIKVIIFFPSASKELFSKLFLASFIIVENCLIPSLVISANFFNISLCQVLYLLLTFFFTEEKSTTIDPMIFSVSSVLKLPWPRFNSSINACHLIASSPNLS